MDDSSDYVGKGGKKSTTYDCFTSLGKGDLKSKKYNLKKGESYFDTELDLTNHHNEVDTSIITSPTFQPARKEPSNISNDSPVLYSRFGKGGKGERVFVDADFCRAKKGGYSEEEESSTIESLHKEGKSGKKASRQ